MAAPIPVETFVDMRIETYTNIAAATLLTYDCLICLHAKATLIWPSRFNIVKLVYFLTRYMAFIDVSLVLFYQLKPNITIHECEVAYNAAGWFIPVGIAIAECTLSRPFVDVEKDSPANSTLLSYPVILLIRTWAIWGRGKIFLAVLITLFVCAAGPALAIEGLFLKSLVFAPLPTSVITGCLVVKGSAIVGVNFVVVIIYETLILILTLIKAIQQIKLSGEKRFVSVLYRDGVLFYFYLLTISIINLIVIFATPRGLATTLALIQRVVHSCVTSRILVNLRRANSRETQANSLASNATELRTIRFTTPSQFASYGSHPYGSNSNDTRTLVGTTIMSEDSGNNNRVKEC
ncbi:hypothetical protein K474DRAFT_1642160 [Panus rudis PR-1116 ss-1]|nr:hypothetical protein K474DRAFT_1642160 [Panus rudis PR-1116 ss-1]